MKHFDIDIQFPIQCNGSIELYIGVITQLYGKIGTGKTTILKYLLEHYSSIGYLHQSEYLIQDLSIEEHFKAMGFDQKDILYYLKKIEMTEHIHHKIHSLSLGERQRIALITLFMSNATILLLDEPIAHLDEHTSKIVMNLLKAECKKRYIMITSHEDKYIHYCDTVYDIQLNKIKGKEKEKGMLVQKSQTFNQLKMALFHSRYHLNLWFTHYLIILLFSISLFASQLVPKFIINKVTEGYGGYVVVKKVEENLVDIKDFSFTLQSYGYNTCTIRPYLFDPDDQGVYLLEQDAKMYSLSIGDTVILDDYEFKITGIIQVDYPKIDNGLSIYTNSIEFANTEYIGRLKDYNNYTNYQFVDNYMPIMLQQAFDWISISHIAITVILILLVITQLITSLKKYATYRKDIQYLTYTNISRIDRDLSFMLPYLIGLFVPYGILLILLDYMIYQFNIVYIHAKRM